MCLRLQKKKWVQLKYFAVVFVFETLYTIGLAILFYVVLPQLDTLRAGMVTNGVFLIPSILLVFKSKEESTLSKMKKYAILALDG